MLAERLYRFSVDRVNGRFISGWCFARLGKSRPVTISIMADNELLGSTLAGEYRRDLQELNLHPTGLCGFDFNFPSSFNPRRHKHINLFFNRRKRPNATIDCREITLLEAKQGTRIFFMHIPKTAGSSFNAFCRQCFASDDYSPHIERLPEDEQRIQTASKSYVAGHLPLHRIDTYNGIADRDLYAIIREPYAHLHSHLNYVRSVHTNAHHDVHYTYQHNDTIRGLGARLSEMDFGDNASVESFIGNLRSYEFDFFDNIQTRYFLDYRPERVKAEDLLNAEKNISRFKGIGLTERYDDFKNRFCDDISVPRQPQTLKSNKAPSYCLFDLQQDSIREVLSPLVVYDLGLYRFVCQQGLG